MNFANYPLDWHICYLRIGSYSYDLNTLNYIMTSLQLYPNIVSSLDYSVEINELTRSKQIQEYGSSKYSIVGCGIRLDRNLRKYMMNYYIPSGLLVTASWVSFSSKFHSNLKKKFLFFSAKFCNSYRLSSWKNGLTCYIVFMFIKSLK